MKNLYEQLGLTSQASLTEIKKAYRKLAFVAHPDRGGDKEKFIILNEAYEVLSDKNKKTDYDKNWTDFKESDLEPDATVVMSGDLPSTNEPAYSAKFKAEHKALVNLYQSSPLKSGSMRDHFKPFKSHLYTFKQEGFIDKKFHDIFTLIGHKNTHADKFLSDTLIPKKKLSLTIATDIITHFLLGHYYGDGLKQLKNYLLSEINKMVLTNEYVEELLLYDGILDILLMAENEPSKQSSLLLSIKKISDFAKRASDNALLTLLPLFYNKHFRVLYAYALHLYWHTKQDSFSKQELTQFDGKDEAKKLFNRLREQLSNGQSNPNRIELIKHVRLLYIFEKDLNGSSNPIKSAAFYRKKAFHLLNWMPALFGQVNSNTLVNIFLQIGINFQLASRSEKTQAIKMSDEGLALKMYLTCIGLGHHATPDIEKYANTQVLKYILAFHFQAPSLKEIIPALQKRTLLLADVFPFFQVQQSNVRFFQQEGQSIQLMRRLLNMMMKAIEYNKTHSKPLSIEHSTVTVLYQVYEACLKNWYQEKHNPDTERKIRLELIEELLFEKGWIFLDIDQNIDSPWIMINRDKEGWIIPSRTLAYKKDSTFTKYRTINGAEINYKTGDIHFFMDPWEKKYPDSEMLFTLFDLQEMLRKNLSSAFFSLDPIDPDKPYHPFNNMRFGPSELYGSELFNTMLLTDYILKFLTTNQEVQGRYPYKQRPVDKMIQHLPEYLRQIISDFHKQEHSGEMHRFWIEAKEINVEVSHLKIKGDEVVRLGLGDIKMVVKKHKLEKDAHGDLKDVGNDDEGWPIYVLSYNEMRDLLVNKTRVIKGHAMVFINLLNCLIYWQDNKIINKFTPKNMSQSLNRLYKQPRDDEEKVIQSFKNMPLIVRVTKAMALQAELSHRYSPEFIFAHEFTTHYDEFAQYLPEFGRLKQLSKMSALIRHLSGIRENNEKQLEIIDDLMNEPNFKPINFDSYEKFLHHKYKEPLKQLQEKSTYITKLQIKKMSNPDLDKMLHDLEIKIIVLARENQLRAVAYYDRSQYQQRVRQDIVSMLTDFCAKFSTTVLSKHWGNKLQSIKNDMGSLSFSKYSHEVSAACQNWYNDISNANPNVPSYRIWQEIINPKRDEIASSLSDNKKSQWKKELYKVFTPLFDHFLEQYEINNLVNSFIQGNQYPLLNALIKQDVLKAQKELKSQFTHSSLKTIAEALGGSSKAIKQIAEDVSHAQLNTVKQSHNQLESGFVKIGLAAEESLNVKGQCFWVPASTRHDVNENSKGGRYSFFVYGGVNIQPKINIIKGNGNLLGGKSVGSGSFNRKEIIKGFQSHHIISNTNNKTKNHDLLKFAGFTNLNSQINRIYLPSNESLHPTRSIHRGRHTTKAMLKVASKMDGLIKQGKTKNWSPTQYRVELRKMISEFRQELKVGNIALNSKHRPWAKY